MSKFIASPQQQAFLDWVSTGSGSCVIEAVAGAGKTTTLLEAVDRTGGGVAIVAYNKKIADELKMKLAKRGVDWKTAEAGTVHSFGLRAYTKTFGKDNVTIDEGKLAGLIVKITQEEGIPATHPLLVFSSIIVKLASMAKQRALGVIGSIDDDRRWFDIIEHFDMLDDAEGAEEHAAEIVELAKRLLKRSNATTNIIDFDDMVYLPVLLKLRFWQYRWLFVDEAQDTNPARRALVKAMLRKDGRLVAVGDRRQAIYGFTGADADSLDLIKRDFNACELPLTVTYRCPKSVVSEARRWVSHIEAHESAPEGMVTSIGMPQLVKHNQLCAGSAILCRNTAPLVTLAFDLIRRKIACRVEGRDIGNGLVKLATKWKSVKTVNGLLTALEKWEASQVARAKAKGKGQLAQSIEDQCATLRVIADETKKAGNDNIPAVVDAIKSLFGDNVDRMLVLSTIHKSKGREWKTVFFLNLEGTIPSPYARQSWQIEQEMNLAYVGVTRAQEQLVYVAP
jgi:superfamily I DNA/RNA helicase